jgi:O-antigen/teichoic acid export membrane protein
MPVCVRLTCRPLEIRIVLNNADQRARVATRFKEHHHVITLCALLLNLAGAVLVYLASGQQRLRTAPLHVFARVLGWLLIVAGVVCWLFDAGVGAGIAAALTTLMLAWVLLPYVAWWRAPDPIKTSTR